jgi:hypothetical protein
MSYILLVYVVSGYFVVRRILIPMIHPLATDSPLFVLFLWFIWPLSLLLIGMSELCDKLNIHPLRWFVNWLFRINQK